MVNHGLCTVTIRSLQMTSIGASITIYCDLFNENLNNLLWRRFNYNGSNILNLINNIPTRYNITSSAINSTNSLSLLQITGVQSEDFATFECSNSNRAQVDLIVAPTTTTTTTTTTAPPPFDPLTLCYNYSYNSVLYSLLLISILILTILLFGFLKLIRPTTMLDIIISFCCVLSAIGFIIIAVIFWISPNYVASSPANAYWSPIIIVPCLMVGLVLVWISIYYFAIRSFLTDKIINKMHMTAISSIAFVQLFFSLIILCSIVYCTGSSKLPAASINYSILSDICSGIIVLSCFVFVVYFFYIFKEQLNDRIGVVSLDKIKIDEFSKTPSLNIDRSKMSSNMDYYFKNPDIVEPYKIDKDKITTAISLIETTRSELMNNDDIVKMRFANDQMLIFPPDLALNDLAQLKKDNLNDSKSELIPNQVIEIEKVVKKKVQKKGKIKISEMNSKSIDQASFDNANVSINNNKNGDENGGFSLEETTGAKKPAKKKAKKNSAYENVAENDEQNIEIINLDEGKAKKKTKKIKKKDDATSSKNPQGETTTTTNVQPVAESGKKLKKKAKTKAKDEDEEPQI